jgi:uncharacterized membrane protein (UPF0127 family)
MDIQALGAALLLTFSPLFCSGCHQTTPSPVVDPTEPTQAQPKLQTLKLYIGSQEMIAELALAPEQVHTGMMFRTNMADNTGMLFALPYTQQAQFWMKNCPLPLSAAYIDPEGIIQEIHDLRPHNTNIVFSASDNIRFVLESPQGWFEKHLIGTNVAVATERGSLMHMLQAKNNPASTN